MADACRAGGSVAETSRGGMSRNHERNHAPPGHRHFESLDARRRTHRLYDGQLLLARLQEVLAPAVIQVRRDALSAASLRDALFTAQSLEHDPDLLFRCELPTRPATDLTHYRFGGLLLLGGHVETLPGVSDPAKCLLAYVTRLSDFC